MQGSNKQKMSWFEKIDLAENLLLIIIASAIMLILAILVAKVGLF